MTTLYVYLGVCLICTPLSIATLLLINMDSPKKDPGIFALELVLLWLVMPIAAVIILLGRK